MSDDVDGERTVSIDSFLGDATFGDGETSSSMAAHSCSAPDEVGLADAEAAADTVAGDDVPEVSRKVTPRFRGRRDLGPRAASPPPLSSAGDAVRATWTLPQE